MPVEVVARVHAAGGRLAVHTQADPRTDPAQLDKPKAVISRGKLWASTPGD